MLDIFVFGVGQAGADSKVCNARDDGHFMKSLL